MTGIVTGQLAASLRDRARETERREREAIVLYDVVRLMAGPELPSALAQVAERIRAELRLDAVAIVLSDIAPESVQAEVGKEEAIALIHSARQLPDNILSEGQLLRTDSTSAGRWIKVVSPSAAAERYGDKRTRVHKVAVNIGHQHAGSLFLAKRAEEGKFTSAENRLLLAVASQLGSAVERARLRDESTEAEVLRRTDELRAALLNAVSHDLRTPPSSIIASAGSLLQADVEWTEADRREFAQAIEQEAERLDRLVGNLLDLSRIEAGSIRPEKGWYHLGSLIEEVANRMRGMTEGNVTVDVPDDLSPLNFDYVEIDQVITNLIDNAVKHTPSGTEVSVSARVADGEVRVEVADSGPGIPEEAMPRLFDAFYRGQGAAWTRGSGLGLAVAKGLVEAHGGRIWVEPQPEGGARFVFVLRVGESPVSQAAQLETKT